MLMVMTDLAPETTLDTLLASRGRSLYLTLDRAPVFAVLHEPPAGTARTSTGVLLCPPFGWDELCTHRSVRAWADALSAAGHATLRIDLPGTGDSGGSPSDPGRLAAWTEAVAAAADWLRASQECERIVAIGLGLGGMLALRALAGGAPIDDLVLWSVPARGSLLLREMRAFAQITAGETGEAEQASPPALDDGALEVAGFVLSAETVAELEQLDLTTLPLPHAARRRILLLGRDTLAPDRRLRAYFERSGAALTTADGPGYGKLVTHPQFAETPHEVFAHTLSWLAAEPPLSEPDGGAPTARCSVASADHADLRVGEVTIRETPFEFDYHGKRLAGVLAQPTASPASEAAICAVLLNAGAVRRIGPNRMWVEAARRWAALGVPSLRLDAVGLGDSDGDERLYYRTSEFYRHEIAEQVLAALDELESRGLPGRFLVGGLCSGAYWGFHAALADERVRGLILVNLWSFVWSEEIAVARDARRARTLLRSGAWREVARIAVGQGRIGRMVRTKLRSVVGAARGDEDTLAELSDAIDDALGQLRDRRVQTLLLLSLGEPLSEDLRDDGRIDRLAEWPNLQLERIPLEDHIFRPVWAQRHVHSALDGALTRTLRDQRARSPIDVSDRST
jgi:pimeloyl-ACP methyl ester carboxylesterase